MMNVFQVVPDMPLSPILDIPETHYFLFWNNPDRAYEVRDVCGWTNRFLTRQIRRMLRAQNVASVFPTIGKVVQQYTKAMAA